MKNVFLFLPVCLLVSLSWQSNNGLSLLLCHDKTKSHIVSEVINDTLKDLDLKFFVHKPVSYFVDSCIVKYDYLNFIAGDETCLRYACVVLNKEVFINLYVDDFKHMTACDAERRWDFKDFLKEEVSKIKIYRNGKLLNSSAKKGLYID